jgi:rhodanese-related sulfurtransferase
MRKNYLKSSIVFLLLLTAGTAWAEKPFAPDKLQGATRVDAEAAAELIVNTPNLLIVDSRKEIEYSKGHIQGSVSLLDTEMTLEKLSSHASDKSTPLLFYCNGERCLRSSRGATKALEWGYKTIYWFRGGWNEWVEKGMPISR